MRNWRAFIAIWGLVLLLPGLGTAAGAQEPAEGEPTPAEEPAVAAEPSDEDAEKKIPFALYVGVAGGTGSSDEFNSSIFADELNAGISEFELDDQLYGKAAIGWKLPHGKGSFRLIFQGVREEGYKFRSLGSSDRLPGGVSTDIESGLVPWWFISVDDGNLNATRLVPMWNSAADTTYGDSDGKPDFGSCADIDGGMFRCGEITYDPASPTRVVSGQMQDDLENRVTTYDMVYGREFGGRRFSSHWWGGLRYFRYDGQLLAGAWLNLGAPGEHFTDGSFERLLVISQETTGMGPVGSWEVDFNFYDRGVQLFLRGEAAFTFNSMKMDSGPFFQILDEDEGTTLDDRLTKDLDKSSWQDRAEVGARLNLKNGLVFEVAYGIAGYLDFILMPDLLQLGVTNEDPQTTTQDIVVETIHAGVAFQF